MPLLLLLLLLAECPPPMVDDAVGNEEEVDDPSERGVPGPYEEEDALELDELDVTRDDVDDDEEADRGPCPCPWPSAGPVYVGICTC